jgi:hypothetical protein
MDKTTLLLAVSALLTNTHPPGDSCAYPQAVRQFNSLLERAKTLYPTRPDINSIDEFKLFNITNVLVFEDAVKRVKFALELVPSTSDGELLAQIKLPADASDDVGSDVSELEGALRGGLEKTVLLLAGSIAECLLIARHPDNSSKGPGLRDLINQARKQNLFGSDTLKLLEALADYRDLIHPRAATRNRIIRNQARVHAAISALKLLCEELQDTDVRFT